jgi:hypothetical protein
VWALHCTGVVEVPGNGTGTGAFLEHGTSAIAVPGHAVPGFCTVTGGIPGHGTAALVVRVHNAGIGAFPVHGTGVFGFPW